jgi:hypothetical protein
MQLRLLRTMRVCSVTAPGGLVKFRFTFTALADGCAPAFQQLQRLFDGR